ncbi:FadR/GntR family transcriptional regulator [Shumkonia mesophila]|uniref:FadR/GntR family transcriptional regulator n=1 Tax=Shumkonia mesophila TaxID=2838854 RepID=UPI002934865F|nr:FCD domain-containing protein [Shumkonia mesophila]
MTGTIKKDLLNRLNALLDSGRFPAQSRLPPERELAAELDTTRTTLRQALAVLEAEGKIWRHVGQGTFVGRRGPNHFQAVSPLVHSAAPADIMETRLIIEPKAAALAALRATAGDIGHLRRCLDKGRAALDLKTYELWDGMLHEAVAEASHSTVLAAMLKALTALREEKLWGRLKEASLTRERQEVYNAQHMHCVEAIAGRDMTGAEAAMRNHLNTVQVDLFGRQADVRT